ncbi:MAG: hypothetical protein ACR2MA_12415 [Egibacteraceae bacterium]
MSAADAVVAATSEAWEDTVVITSDRKDLEALLVVASGRSRLLVV